MRASKTRRKRYRAPSPMRRVMIFAMLALSVYLVTVGLSGQWLPDALTRPGALWPSASPTSLGTQPFAPGATSPPTQQALVIAGQEWFALQFGAYSTLGSAQIDAASYVGRGAAGYIVEDGAFRLLGAVYPARKDAETVRDQLREAHRIETILYRIAADEVVLNITASQEQVAALSQAYAFLPEMLSEFNRLSVAVDKRTMDGAAAAQAAQQRLVQASSIRMAITQQMGGTQSAVITELDALLSACEGALQEIVSMKNETLLAISTRIKYNQLDVLWRYVRYVRAITANRTSS